MPFFFFFLHCFVKLLNNFLIFFLCTSVLTGLEGSTHFWVLFNGSVTWDAQGTPSRAEEQKDNKYKCKTNLGVMFPSLLLTPCRRFALPAHTAPPGTGYQHCLRHCPGGSATLPALDRFPSAQESETLQGLIWSEISAPILQNS